MEWLLSNPQLHSTFASLGSMQGDMYTVNADCSTVLEEIHYKLTIEDHTLRTFRRAIGFGNNIKNDIVPLLINVKDSHILDSTIRLLVNLTVPIECLLSLDAMCRTEVGQHTIFELNKLLFTSKETFVDSKSTKAIIDHMKNILEKDTKLSMQQCDSINNCLLLLRNILHIPEPVNHSQSGITSLQNQIVWHLFTQSIDKLLIYLMSCPQRAYWGVTMAQLVALMYKDQPVSTLQKLLNLWFDATLSDSSEDNESNTSPPKSGDSSPMSTSDPTSDSSDNGGGGTKMECSTSKDSDDTEQISRMGTEFPNQIIRNRPPKTHQKSVDSGCSSGASTTSTTHATDSKQKISLQLNEVTKYLSQQQNKQSENSDCGYSTQVEKESISTSSNEDECRPVHQKPPTNQKQRFNAANKQRNPITSQDKKELRRKKLVKRSKSNMINMKGLMHHTPTDEDISNILKEFTVDFLLKGYGYLVQELHLQLLADIQVQIDTSHFFWLVTYFLKFATQLELDLEHIHTVMSFDMISFLTYEGVTLCEELEILNKQAGMDVTACLRRSHLVVTAIREFLQALETYKKSTHLSLEDKDYLKQLQLQISSSGDLKCLFVLLLRCYNPVLQSHQYLQDLIVTNHILLLMLDGVSEFPDYKGTVQMCDHIKQFATVEIMHQYGLLLEGFRENGEFVNDCIFTMMHHIGGDLGQISVLFQPSILKTYSQIWETEYEVCDDWSDLIEYVIHKFIHTPQPSPLTIKNATLPELNTTLMSESMWTQEEKDSLYWYYVQNKNSKNMIGEILSLFRDNGSNVKTRVAVIQQLLQQDIITLLKYDDLMKVEFDINVYTPAVSICTSESGVEMNDGIEPHKLTKAVDDIQVLRDRLCKENKENMLIWLQKSLLDCCLVKIQTKALAKNPETDAIMEPIAYHCILKKQSIPVIPWNMEQNDILSYQPFLLLLHKLGFHLPADTNKSYVRIPEFWTENILYSTAQKLGPIDKALIKFDVKLINKVAMDESIGKNVLTYNMHKTGENFGISRSNKSNSVIRFTPDLQTNWLQIVKQNKNFNRNESLLKESTPYENSTAAQHIHDDVLRTISNATERKFLGHITIEPALHDIKCSELEYDLDNTEVPALEEHEVVSTCETASVASDLMYVSDEEDKHDIDAIKIL